MPQESALSYEDKVARAVAWFEDEKNFMDMLDAVTKASEAGDRLKKASVADPNELNVPVSI